MNKHKKSDDYESAGDVVLPSCRSGEDDEKRHRRSADDSRASAGHNREEDNSEHSERDTAEFWKKRKSGHNRLGDNRDVVARQNDDMNNSRPSEIFQQVFP